MRISIVKFFECVEINPKINIKKGERYSYIDMKNIIPRNRFVFSKKKGKYMGNGSKFQNNDILFARITPCLENGKIAQYKSKNLKPSFGSTEFLVFRAKEKIISKSYLYYLCISNLVRKTAEKSMTGASGRQRVNFKSIKNIEINLPRLFVQEKISSILSAYDELIEKNNRRIEILEEMAQAIYKEWFVYFRFPGHKEVKMVDSELGKIPEGWKVKEIKNFGKIITGKTPSTLIKENYGSYMPFIKIPDMRNNMYIIKTGKYLSKKGTESQNNKIIPSNSLCVSCIGSVGIVSINLVDSQTNQQINSIVLDEKEYLEFLFFKLKSMKKQIENYGRKGATMNNLNKKEFSELKIMSPTKDLIKKFNELTFAFFEEIKILLIKNTILSKTRALLLPKLISGEINVENLDIYTEDDIK